MPSGAGLPIVAPAMWLTRKDSKAIALVGGAGFAAVTLLACSAAPATVGQPTAFASVCDKANDGHRVQVAGYMRLPDQITVETDRTGGDARELLVVRLF